MRADAAPMVGRRFGNIVVLKLHDRLYAPGGQAMLMWQVQCDCGARVVMRGGPLRAGRVKRCVRCARVRQAEANRQASIRLSDGRLLVDVAAAHGLKLDTVYMRWRRGWPEELLGISPLNQGQKR